MCCESNSEERSAGNPHACFCGGWGIQRMPLLPGLGHQLGSPFYPAPGVTVGWLRSCGTAGKPGGNREDKHQPVPLGEPGLLTKSSPALVSDLQCFEC